MSLCHGIAFTHSLRSFPDSPSPPGSTPAHMVRFRALRGESGSGVTARGRSWPHRRGRQGQSPPVPKEVGAVPPTLRMPFPCERVSTSARGRWRPVGWPPTSSRVSRGKVAQPAEHLGMTEDMPPCFPVTWIAGHQPISIGIIQPTGVQPLGSKGFCTRSPRRQSLLYCDHMLPTCPDR